MPPALYPLHPSSQCHLSFPVLLFIPLLSYPFTPFAPCLALCHPLLSCFPAFTLCHFLFLCTHSPLLPLLSRPSLPFLPLCHFLSLYSLRPLPFTPLLPLLSYPSLPLLPFLCHFSFPCDPSSISPPHFPFLLHIPSSFISLLFFTALTTFPLLYRVFSLPYFSLLISFFSTSSSLPIPALQPTIFHSAAVLHSSGSLFFISPYFISPHHHSTLHLLPFPFPLCCPSCFIPLLFFSSSASHPLSRHISSLHPFL